MKTKKELKEAYGQMKFDMGIFQIRNMLDGKVFIGSATNLKAKWNMHRTQLEAGNHLNTRLQADWNAEGADNFVYEIVELLPHSDDPNFDVQRELKALEALVVETLQPYDEKGYNIRPRR